ncbi:MAG: HAMP domain-containing histidine kinase [Ignavibacteria bacterium]|nr:HAMP domain-containing histidine kinase [Ignavibacteria bacterium]
MINLIPLQTKDLGYLWQLVSERNKWFIKLRYIAVIMLLCLYVFIIYISNENIHAVQKTGIAFIFTGILLYNLIFSYITTADIIKNDVTSFNPMKFALIQIVCDISSLMIIVYLTGLINSPFSMFFIFHAIIGSLILPGRVVYFIVFIVLSVFTALTMLTHSGILPEFPISNTAPVEMLSLNYLVLNLLSFWLMILLSVMFVNFLTSALYRREQQLIEAIQKIEKAETDKQNYILAVVHEVKSPLSVIVSYLNLLINGITGEINDKAMNILTKMKKRSDEAIELTNNILEVSKIRELKNLDKENLNVETLIRDVFEKIKVKAEEDEVTLHFTDCRKDKNTLYADRHLLEIVLSNLISNSVKYNHAGGRADIILSDRNNDLCISVTDTGIGIPADESNLITSEFYRASNAKQYEKDGTGLGLYVVSQIVNKHGGKLYIKSPSGIGNQEFPGTSIVINLPYQIQNEIPVS